MCIQRLFILIFFAISLAPTSAQTPILINSLSDYYKKANPTLNYQFDEKNQTHNFSDNWDLDNDSIMDEVHFVGTGGAHLYFFLRVVLSSDKMVRDFSFLQTDLPLVPNEELQSHSDFHSGNMVTNIAVINSEATNNLEIIIRLDNPTYLAVKKQLRKRGIKSKLVTVSFRNGKTIFGDISSE